VRTVPSVTMAAARCRGRVGVTCYRERPSPGTLGVDTNVSPIPSSNCLILTLLFLCTEHVRIESATRSVKVLGSTLWLKQASPQRQPM
jgi:hypothetical protein